MGHNDRSPEQTGIDALLGQIRDTNRSEWVRPHREALADRLVEVLRCQSASKAAALEAMADRVESLLTAWGDSDERDEKNAIVADLRALQARELATQKDDGNPPTQGVAARVPHAMFAGDTRNPLMNPAMHDGYTAGFNACRELWLAGGPVNVGEEVSYIPHDMTPSPKDYWMVPPSMLQ